MNKEGRKEIKEGQNKERLEGSEKGTKKGRQIEQTKKRPRLTERTATTGDK